MKTKSVLAFCVVAVWIVSFGGTDGLRAQATPPDAQADLSRMTMDPFQLLKNAQARFFPGQANACAAPANQIAGEVDGGRRRLLPFTVTGVDASMDVTQDIALQNGLLITGEVILPASHMAAGIRARNAAGQLFIGNINPETLMYEIAVPPDTYNLDLCYTGASNAGDTYNDPDAVEVVADVTGRNVMPPAIVTRRVSGMVTSDPAFPLRIVNFVSSDARKAGNALVFPFLGTYDTRLPDGSYTVGLLQLPFDGSRFSQVILGTAEVAGADVVMDFTAPPTATLAGVVSRAGGGAIPPGSFATASDAGAGPPDLAVCGAPLFPFGFGAVNPDTGAYSLSLQTGATYNFSGNLAIFPMDGMQLAGAWGMPAPTNPFEFPGDLTLDLMFPETPNPVLIAGVVTDPDGAPVSGAFLCASSMELTGAPGTLFNRCTTASKAGAYSVQVLSGINYRLDVFLGLGF